MSVIKYKGPDKTVNTINDRNNIPGDKRVDRMAVLVKDAIADTSAGKGWALYIWSSSKNNWLLVSKEINDTISFATEEKTINNDTVMADNVPKDKQVWNCFIVTPDGAVIEISPVVDAGVINIDTETPGEYDGCRLRYTYAYGKTGAQITEMTYTKTQVTAMMNDLRNELDAKLAELGSSVY